MSGIGGIISGIRSFLPSSTSSSGTSHLDANTDQETANIAGSILEGSSSNQQVSGQTTNQSESQKSDSATTSNQTQATSVSDETLKAIRSNLSLAQANATDPTKTKDLVSNILQQAAMTFAPTLSNAVGAGLNLYTSPTLDMLKGFSEAQATTQAAKTVLDYETAQQTLAQQGAGQLIDATKMITTAGSTSSTSNALTNVLSTVMSSLFANSANQQDLLTANQGTQTGHSEQNQSSNQSGSSGLSVVCTELERQGKLSEEELLDSRRRFKGYWHVSRKAYYTWAVPATQHMQKYPDGKLSKFLLRVMAARTKRKFWAVAGVAVFTTMVGFFVWLPRKTWEVAGELMLSAFEQEYK